MGVDWGHHSNSKYAGGFKPARHHNPLNIRSFLANLATALAPSSADALSFAGILSPSFRVFDSMRRVDVATGTVKWFNSTKGYGFIQPDGGGKDVFVHISAVEKAGFSSLAEGAKVSYEIVSDRGKESAGNLRL